MQKLFKKLADLHHVTIWLKITVIIDVISNHENKRLNALPKEDL